MKGCYPRCIYTGFVTNSSFFIRDSLKQEITHEQVLELSKKYRIKAVPTLFFADGGRLQGAVDLKSLEARLNMN